MRGTPPVRYVLFTSFGKSTWEDFTKSSKENKKIAADLIDKIMKEASDSSSTPGEHLRDGKRSRQYDPQPQLVKHKLDGGLGYSVSGDGRFVVRFMSLTLEDIGLAYTMLTSYDAASGKFAVGKGGSFTKQDFPPKEGKINIMLIQYLGRKPEKHLPK